MLPDTAARALEVYGGRERWTAARTVEAVASAGGLAFKFKWQKTLDHIRLSARLSGPVIRLDPIDGGERAGVLDGHDVRLEDRHGKILAERKGARKCFSCRRLLWWDVLDQIYFAGYAFWNYLTFPALLLRKDIQWIEPSPDTLEAIFPEHLPTHCRRQRFLFDPETGLLRRHDYTAEVIGRWARGAHVILEHRLWERVPFPSKRRVTPIGKGDRPRSSPTLIWIEVHKWRLI